MNVYYINDKFIATYQEDAHELLEVFSAQQPAKFLTQIKLPDIGTIQSERGHYNEKEFFFKFTSFSDPGSIYRVDMDSLAVE